MPRKYKAILFDMDGTLVDTDELIAQTFFYLYDKYRDGNRASREKIIYFSGPPIKETLAKEFPHVDQNLIFKEFHDVSWNFYPRCIKSYPGAKETLLALKEQGYQLGIVTNKIHKTTEYCLQLLDLENIFDVIIGFDDVDRPKPYPDGIYLAMKRLNQTEKEDVLYIGDNGSDLLTSQNAGIDCGLIAWGPRVLNHSLKPKYLIKSYCHLKEVLENE
ncbi:MAG TPA: HAD-IA family hydrolase [Bacilli bacterium]|nr:HAD-IA family hydrolase [Bacilli bacterium]HPS18678.1 HAD-IA family hydrolase [Bacilli bacterium]